MPGPRIRTLEAASLCLLLSGCPDAGSANDASTDDPVDAPEECRPESGSEIDLLGWWAAKAWVRVEVVTSPEGIVRMCPDPHPGVAVLTLMIHLREQTGSRIDYDFVVCEIAMPRVTTALAPCEFEEYLSVQLELGPELAAYIPSQEFHGYAELGGEGPCSTYVSDTLDITYGYDPEVIDSEEPLPGWNMACGATVPEVCVSHWDNVIDEDGDGHPGVSLQVTTDPVNAIWGQAYTTWRTNPHMHGEAWSSTLIQGDLSPTMEYDVVGSGATMEGIPMDEPTVKLNIPRFLIPAEGSSFRQVRVDGLHGSENLDADGDDVVDCEELMARLDVLE
jgi:hypothetical protein